jgi:hypothetical protein
MNKMLFFAWTVLSSLQLLMFDWENIVLDRQVM